MHRPPEVVISSFPNRHVLAHAPREHIKQSQPRRPTYFSNASQVGPGILAIAVLLAVLPPAFQGSWARALRVARGARRELEAEDFRELLERPQGAEDLQDELGGVEPVVMGLNSV